MTNSILWAGYPRWYSKGRARPVQFVTLHYTAGSEGPNSAESGVQYDKTRPDQVSSHYYVDSLGPALQEVPDGDRAYTARFHGNEIGIHIEICGTRQTRAQWLDGTSQATLNTTAWLVATLLKRHGLAFRRLTTSETRAAYYNPAGQRPTGINDHNACTLAFPEDGGTHTDVGPEFPWDVFMPLVRQYLGGQMAKIIKITEPVDSVVANALYGTGGGGFFHLFDWDDAVVYGNEWGLDPNQPNWTGPLEEAYRRFGPYLGEYNQLAAGPPGEPGHDGEDGQDGAPGVGFAPGQIVTVTGTVTVS